MEHKCANHHDVYQPEMATILKTEQMTKLERFFEIKLDSGKELGHMPGQFVEVSIMGIGEAPVSVSSSPTQRGSFQLVVRNAGNVTNVMHRLKPGDKLGIRGPFGKYFPVDSVMKGKDILFVCGGIGIVPVRSAINYVLDHRQDYGKVFILFGAKCPDDCLFVNETRKYSSKENVTYLETVDYGDENWKGNVGVITTLSPKVSINAPNTIAVVCGPPIMYKFVIMELHKMNMTNENIYVSLERRMKCGVGKCGHCQINGLYVCQDGPVFKYSDVTEVQEAI